MRATGTPPHLVRADRTRPLGRDICLGCGCADTDLEKIPSLRPDWGGDTGTHLLWAAISRTSPPAWSCLDLPWACLGPAWSRFARLNRHAPRFGPVRPACLSGPG